MRRIRFRFLIWIVHVFLIFLFSACTSKLTPLQMDLEAPGWNIRTGQAVWNTKSNKKPVIGDIVLAQHESGDAWINFSKSSLPVFSAQVSDNRWWIDMVVQNKQWSGRGKPPRRFAWFKVIDTVFKNQIPKDWSVVKPSAEEWLISNQRTDESIRLILDI